MLPLSISSRSALASTDKLFSPAMYANITREDVVSLSTGELLSSLSHAKSIKRIEAIDNCIKYLANLPMAICLYEKRLFIKNGIYFRENY